MDDRPDITTPDDLPGKRYPLLPLRDIVIFPHMVIPLFVGRPKSIKALELAMDGDKTILLATQKDPKLDDPVLDDLYSTGALGKVVQLLRLPDGTVKALIEGEERAQISSFIPGDDCLFCEVEMLRHEDVVTPEAEALIRSVREAFEAYVRLSKKLPAEIVDTINSQNDPSRIADSIAAQINVDIEIKQDILTLTAVHERLERLLSVLTREVEILEIEQKIRSRVKSQMERSQKEYYLNEQMRAIQKELGEKDEFKQELRELEESIKKKRMSNSVSCANSR